MNRTYFRWVARPAVLMAVIFAASCSSTPASLQGKIGSQMVLSHNLWVESNVHRTTNYLSGQEVPVNTAVIIRDISSNKIVFQVADTGNTIAILNVQKHSGMDITGIFRRTFSEQPVAILKGRITGASVNGKNRIIPGMTKDAVIQAVGYPPAHETPTLSKDEWTYWTNRFNRIRVRFLNDQVVKVSE